MLGMQPIHHHTPRAIIAMLASASDLSSTERLVMLLLMAHADQDGKTWVSRERLTELTRMHHQTINNALRSLKDKGCITAARWDPKARLYIRTLTWHQRPSMADVRSVIANDLGVDLAASD